MPGENTKFKKRRVPVRPFPGGVMVVAENGRPGLRGRDRYCSPWQSTGCKAAAQNKCASTTDEVVFLD